jgi:hypothetical protein
MPSMRARFVILLLGVAALLAPGPASATPGAGANGEIVFTRVVGAVHQIYVASAGGGGATNISNNTYDDVDPAVSPDGTRIAFARQAPGFSGHNIFVMNIDGSGTPIRVTASVNDERDPAWSPDGNTIAYSENTTGASQSSQLLGWEIYEVGAGGSSPHLAVSEDGDDRYPSFSPDGNWLSWSNAWRDPPASSGDPNGPTQDYEVWEATAAGGNPFKVFQNVAGVQNIHPVWSPDSTRQAWSCDTDVCVINPDGYVWTVRSPGAANGTDLAWSPDGQKILFTSASNDLAVMNPDGSGVTALTSSGGDAVEDWAPASPANVRIPNVAGSLNLGDTLVADTGVWIGSGLTFQYQWKRCNPPGGNGCVDIPGATSPAYTTTVTDLNASLRVFVTATGSSGSATAASAPYGPIANVIASSLPTITFSGLLGTGTGLSAHTGDVGSGLGNAPITFAFAWQRCDIKGNACVAIASATAPTYIVAVADAGHTMRVVVTATNTSGSATGTSLATTVVGGLAPSNTVIPVIAGSPVIGQTLTASTGTWTGAAGTTFTYQWRRCSAGGDNCLDVTGATGSTYLVVSDDAGTTLLVKVTATNASGIVSASSLVTGIVGATQIDPGPGFPASTIAPRLVGASTVGETLTASIGGFVGAGLAYAFQWQRCNTTVTTCTPIAGAAAVIYKPVQADVGSTIRVFVTATNSLGSATAVSDVTSPVAVAPLAVKSSSTQGLKTVLRGTAHADRLVVRRGQTRIVAGAGNDRIFAADGRREVIDCGPGNDTVTADRVDRLLHCEHVRYAKRVAARS